MTSDDFRFDGVVRLTKVGSSFVIFTIVIGFAAINTGNNSLYIGLAFMLGTLLLSGVASQRGLRQLRVEFDSLGAAWAGRFHARGRGVGGHGSAPLGVRNRGFERNDNIRDSP